MFKEKSFSFEDVTLKKGLERLLPNLIYEKQEAALSIIGYAIYNYLKGNIDGDRPDFYRKLETCFNNPPEESIRDHVYLVLGKDAKRLLFEEIKAYNLGLCPTKEKLSMYRTKELEILSREI